MLKDRIYKKRIKYVITDYIMSAIAFLAFNIVRFYSLHLDFKGYHNIFNFILSSKMLLEEILFPCIMLGVYWLSGYYNKPFGKSRVQELITTFFSALLNTAIILLTLLTNDMVASKSLNIFLILILIIFLFIFPYIGRWILTSKTIKEIKKNEVTFRTLVIGNSEKAHELVRNLKNSRNILGYDIVGYVDIPGENSTNDKGLSFLEIEQKAIELNVSQIILSPEANDDKRMLDLLSRLYTLPVSVKIKPDTISFITYGIHLNDIYGEPFIELTSPCISDSTKNVKRTIDVIVSSIVLIALSPIYLALAIAVKLTSPGPVIYRQERLGLRRHPFKICKFRTMKIDAEASGPQLSSENDSRITPLGSIMRKYRLDELPQFWNVLKGEMSIVGPRPEREYYARKIVKYAPFYNMVHQVRPGITSWGMVKYGYANTVEKMVERSRYDLVYLTNMSISVDLKIIIHTIKTVVSGVGL